MPHMAAARAVWQCVGKAAVADPERQFRYQITTPYKDSHHPHDITPGILLTALRASHSTSLPISPPWYPNRMNLTRFHGVFAPTVCTTPWLPGEAKQEE